MNENDNEVIDYEKIFKNYNKKQKEKKTLTNKSILTLLLYFFIMFAGGLFVLTQFISEMIVEPYNSNDASVYVMDYVANNDNSMGLVYEEDFELLVSSYNLEENEFDIIIKVGSYTIDNKQYNLVISGNQSDSVNWLLLNNNLNEPLFNDIITGNKQLWDNTNEKIIFYTYINSPEYNYFNEQLKVIDNNPIFLVDQSVSIAFANIVNVLTYLFVTIPIFFIFKKDLKYDYLLLKKDDDPIISNVLKGFSFMLLTSVILGVITMWAQSLFNISGDSLNQEAVSMAVRSKTGILMILSAVVLAPIVEELVFRKAIFSLIKKPQLAIFISSITFGLIHVLTEPNITQLLIQSIPYVGMGAFLGWYYYYKTDKNIVTLILMHGASNLFSVIGIFIA